MADHDAIQRAVHQALAVLNDTLGEQEQVPTTADTLLVELDSLGITNLIVALENAIFEELGEALSLTDEKTLNALQSPETTPLRTVQTLIEYVARLVDEGDS